MIISSISTQAQTSRWAFILRALRYKNYRLFFCGQLVSLIGTWMSTVAASWLVYRLTGSAFYLGILGFAGQFPAFLLSPVAGIFVDRWNQHRLLIATQTLSMLQSFAFAFFVLTGRINIAGIILLHVFQGFINAFDMPCRQSFVVTMIERKEDLGNAIALNSSMFNVARLVGPSIGGLIISLSNEGWCFLIDGISFLAVLAALLTMNIQSHPARASQKHSVLRQLREGYDYVAGSLPIRSIILLLALISLVGIPYMILIPVFAGKILGGGPHTLGFLMAAAGGGALLGALWLAARKNVLHLTGAIPVATVIFGLGLISFALSHMLWLSLPLLVVTGFGFMVQIASSNTILQTISDDDKRGRVMSFFMMAFLGTAPFGSLLSGILSDRIGAPNTLVIGGLCCLLSALWFANELPDIRRAVRPIYIKMGILPELVASLESVSEWSVPPED